MKGARIGILLSIVSVVGVWVQKAGAVAGASPHPVAEQSFEAWPDLELRVLPLKAGGDTFGWRYEFLGGTAAIVDEGSGRVLVLFEGGCLLIRPSLGGAQLTVVSLSGTSWTGEIRPENTKSLEEFGAMLARTPGLRRSLVALAQGDSRGWQAAALTTQCQQKTIRFVMLLAEAVLICQSVPETIAGAGVCGFAMHEAFQAYADLLRTCNNISN